MGTISYNKVTPPKIAAIGCGPWGRNIVRNLAELGALSAVCDINTPLAEEFARKYDVPVRTMQEILEDKTCGGVAVASPATLHVKHAAEALNAGKHVFVEKPLALTASEGHALARLANDRRRILMVGHLLQYHPLVRKMFDLVHEGHLGEIKHIACNRLHVGRVRDEENVIWSLAPHDVSVILTLMGDLPKRVSVQATNIVNPNIADIANIHLKFASGVSAQIHVSWFNPYKEQRLVVTGTKASIVFDDGAPNWEDRLYLYERQRNFGTGKPWKERERQRISVIEREPLREECSHFLESILGGTTPRTDAEEALNVLAVLDGASRSLASGRPEAI